MQEQAAKFWWIPGFLQMGPQAGWFMVGKYDSRASPVYGNSMTPPWNIEPYGSSMVLPIGSVWAMVWYVWSVASQKVFGSIGRGMVCFFHDSLRDGVVRCMTISGILLFYSFGGDFFRYTDLTYAHFRHDLYIFLYCMHVVDLCLFSMILHDWLAQWPICIFVSSLCKQIPRVLKRLCQGTSTSSRHLTWILPEQKTQWPCLAHSMALKDMIIYPQNWLSYFLSFHEVVRSCPTANQGGTAIINQSTIWDKSLACVMCLHYVGCLTRGRLLDPAYI